MYNKIGSFILGAFLAILGVLAWRSAYSFISLIGG